MLTGSQFFAIKLAQFSKTNEKNNGASTMQALEVINKSQLIADLATEHEYLDETLADNSVRMLLDLIMDTLADDGRVEIRGFGSFSLHHRSPRTARNPRTGESVTVGSKAVPHFKPGKALREAVDYQQ